MSTFPLGGHYTYETLNPVRETGALQGTASLFMFAIGLMFLLINQLKPKLPPAQAINPKP